MTGNSELAGTEASPSLCCCSVAQLCLTLCNPMDCSTPGFPVLHCLPEFAPLSQWCHPTTSFSIAPFSLCPQSFLASGSFPISQLFESDGKILELRLQHQFFQWIFRVDFLQEWLVWSPCSPRDYQESSLAPQFKSINSSVLSLLYGPTHIHIWLLEKPQLWLHRPLSAKWCLLFNTLSRFVIAFLPRSKRLLKCQ